MQNPIHQTKLFLLFIASTLIMSACTGTRPKQLGEAQASLQVCPSSPNCVSSLKDEDKDHFIESISYTNKPSTHEALVKAINSDESAELVVKTDQYIYAEYTSAIMRYVDDVEFLFDDNQQRIHVRSASRLGHSDFGVNRDRIEQIRSQLNDGAQ
ncbi:MAG: DUF1499 domain-containing protein [Oleiphilaceae bacterium]|nr:DUF1499 domain-containing protein [Oleiphilaceae bacterium]